MLPLPLSYTLVAYFAHRDHSNRAIVISRFGAS
jgi:hypothetical protein